MAVVRIKTNLWYQWTRIAIENERHAHRARAQLLESWARASDTSPMTEETAYAMVAVVACAHALDALHADVAPLVGRKPDVRDQYTGAKRRPRAAVYMFHTFRDAFPEARRWEAGWLEVFALRDNAVHFRGGFDAPTPHPAIAVRTSAENTTFTSESARAAVDLLVRVIRVTLSPNATVPALSAWGRGLLPTAAELASLRASSDRTCS